MRSAVFASDELESVFSDNGFVLIPGFLIKDELNELRTLFKTVYDYKGESDGMWNSLYNLPTNESGDVSRRILSILGAKLSITFVNYRTPVASFMVKNPNKNGITDLHRDYTTQDEREFQYRNIWIPLVDTNPENGALYALKRSHTFFDYPLPMFCKWPYAEHQEMLFKYCDIIYAAAGDLVVYADRALHGSLINQTLNPRPVVHLGLLHPAVELCYYFLDEKTNEVTIYDVPFSFFFENKFGNQEGRFKVRKRFAYHPPALTKEEMLKGLKLL